MHTLWLVGVMSKLFFKGSYYIPCEHIQELEKQRQSSGISIGTHAKGWVFVECYKCESERLYKGLPEPAMWEGYATNWETTYHKGLLNTWNLDGCIPWDKESMNG